MKLLKYIIAVLLLLDIKANAQTNTAVFDYKSPTFKLEGEQLNNQSKFLRFTVITGYREGIQPIQGGLGMKLGVYNDPRTGTSRIAMLNLSVQDMLVQGINPAQVVFEVKDNSKYSYDPKYGNQQEWLHKNGWCYEFALPIGTFPLSNILDFIRTDVARQFNLKITKEKRMTDEQHRYGLSTDERNQEVEVFIVTDIN